MRALLAAPLLLLALPFGLAGCKGNSLDGKWNVSGAQGLPPGATAVYEFNGGTATLTTSVKQPQIGELNFTVTGPYTVDGEKLKLGPQTVKLDESKVNPQMRPMLKSLNIEGQMAEALKKENVATIKFDSSDRVLLTSAGNTATLTRVK